MAKKERRRRLGKVVLGFVLGVLAVAAVVFVYLRFGALPVAMADKPFPLEKQIVKVPLKATD